MKKYLYNFYIILRNIQNYGLFTIIKASIIEIIYLIKFKDFKSYIYDENFTSSYDETKSEKTYNTQHTPTPYFFLNIGHKFIKKQNLNDFVLIDLGCGYGRVGDFFSLKYNCLFYGIEINKNFVDYLEKKNVGNSKKKFFQLDLKNKIEREKIFKEILEIKKKIIIFISDPFDIFTIIEILEYFKNHDHLVLGVNINQLDKLNINYKQIYIKTFNKGQRHIILLKPKKNE